MPEGHRLVAVVTGGSGGIGQAIAQELGARGYAVAVVGSTAAKVQAAVSALRAVAAAGSAVLGLTLDVTSEADMDEMSAAVLERFDRIDLLVASAGIGRKPGSARLLPYALQDLPLDEWRAVLDVNLTGVFLANRAVLGVMEAQGGGRILNVGSSTTPYGLKGTPYAAAYCASKYALVGLTEALAAEVAPLGIPVQLVFPGPVGTPLVERTALDRPFGGSVSASDFAVAVADLLGLPADGILVHPHLLPVATRRGRLGSAPPW
jgi:NAD(P)-dependent dehydrogenase (short-subunit alcohol dehydrogenase family)